MTADVKLTDEEFLRAVVNKPFDAVTCAEFMRLWSMAHRSITYVSSRAEVIEEIAKAVEAAPLTYAGPDPGGIRDLRTLIVMLIRDQSSSDISQEGQ